MTVPKPSFILACILACFFTYPVLVVSQDNAATTPDPTPVLPYIGQKSYDEGDCLNWTTIAYIQLSYDNPIDKQKKIEPKACKLSDRLECLNITDNKGSSKDLCRCMISLGPHPITIDDSDGKKQCYIPAGLGWFSECFQNGVPPEALFPLPYGDPRGSGPDPPYEIDQKNSDSGETNWVSYTQWNSIDLPCVPNAECREGANYIGRRCQCFKNATFHRKTGTCSGTVSLKFSKREVHLIRQLQNQWLIWGIVLELLYLPYLL